MNRRGAHGKVRWRHPVLAEEVSPGERQTGGRHLDLSREDRFGLSAIDRESELFPHVSQDEDLRARGDGELTGLGRGQ